MADKKLNEVTKVTDMAYVPVIMADGTIGQIAKADLASVVAGIIGYPLTPGVLPSIGVNSVGDPSSITKTCFGFFNNTLGDDTYCPKAGGIFLRLYGADQYSRITLYFIYKYDSGLYGVYVKPDNDVLIKISRV